MISVAKRTFSTKSMPDRNADWYGEIAEDSSCLSMLDNSLDTTLHTVLQQAIGLKSMILNAFGIFVMRGRIVAFHCFKICPKEKNSATTLHESGHTTLQQPLENSEGKPSRPGALFLGREKKVSFIFSGENNALSQVL